MDRTTSSSLRMPRLPSLLDFCDAAQELSETWSFVIPLDGESVASSLRHVMSSDLDFSCEVEERQDREELGESATATSAMEVSQSTSCAHSVLSAPSAAPTAQRHWSKEGMLHGDELVPYSETVSLSIFSSISTFDPLLSESSSRPSDAKEQVSADVTDGESSVHPVEQRLNLLFDSVRGNGSSSIGLSIVVEGCVFLHGGGLAPTLDVLAAGNVEVEVLCCLQGRTRGASAFSDLSVADRHGRRRGVSSDRSGTVGNSAGIVPEAVSSSEYPSSEINWQLPIKSCCSG